MVMNTSVVKLHEISKILIIIPFDKKIKHKPNNIRFNENINSINP